MATVTLDGSYLASHWFLAGSWQAPGKLLAPGSWAGYAGGECSQEKARRFCPFLSCPFLSCPGLSFPFLSWHFVIHSLDFIRISLSKSLTDNFLYTLIHRGQPAGACAPRFSLGAVARRSPIGYRALFHPYNNRIPFLPNKSRVLISCHWRLLYEFSSLGAAKKQPGGLAARTMVLYCFTYKNFDFHKYEDLLISGN